MTSPKPRRHFNLSRDDVAEPLTDDDISLRSAQRFDAAAREEMPTDDAVSRQALPEQSLGAPRKRRWGLLFVLSGSVVLGIAELATGLPDTFASARWLDAAWQVLGLAAICLGGATMLRELARLKRLKHHDRLREALTELPQRSPKQAKQLAGRLQTQLKLSDDDPHWAAFQHASEPHHDGQETLTLLDHHLLAPRDREARRLISRMCGETAVMVAVSPLTLVDMALVAWRNIAMVNRLCRLYGLELGYASRLRLFKTVLHNMAFAGASELAADAGMDMLSLDMTGRLSARAGQGLAIGLLSARLGLRALRLCRPLAFTPDQQPTLGDLRRELWQQLRRLDAKPDNSGE